MTDHEHGGHSKGNGQGAGHGDGHDHGDGHGEEESAYLAEMLDLDAEILGDLLAEMIDSLDEPAADRPVRRIADLGAGTGTGTFALARRFPDAEVTALDKSDEMLRRLDGTARERGLAGRIRTVQADLDTGWPALVPVDLIWAANSLHHLADPDRVFAEVLAALNPGGRLAVAEMDSFPRFLPDDLGLGRPGLEARCLAALAESMAQDLPYMGDDWGARLAKAGFAVDAERHFAAELTAPLPAGAGRFAQLWLGRLRTRLDGRLDADELATLDLLVADDGPESVRRRADLTVRAARTVWVARRP